MFYSKGNGRFELSSSNIPTHVTLEVAKILLPRVMVTKSLYFHHHFFSAFIARVPVISLALTIIKNYVEY